MTRSNTSNFAIRTFATSIMISASSVEVYARGQPPRPLMLSAPGLPSSVHEPATREAYRQVIKAEGAVYRTSVESRRNFESSAEFRQAVDDARQARADFERARAEIIQQMQQSSEYKAAQINLWKAQQNVTALQSSPRTPPAQLAEAAAELLRHRAVVTQIETDAIGKDESLRTRRFAAIDAEARVAGLRQSFNESITSNPEFRAAKNDLDQARKHLNSIGR